jgi:signal transduction histidine kinase
MVIFWFSNTLFPQANQQSMELNEPPGLSRMLFVQYINGRLLILFTMMVGLFACQPETPTTKNNAGQYVKVLDSGWTYTPSQHQLPRIQVQPTHDVHEFLATTPAPFTGWLHNEFSVPENWPSIPYALTVLQSVASEIYIDGHLVEKYGHIDSVGNGTKDYDPILFPESVDLKPGTKHRIDVKIGLAKGTLFTTIVEIPNPLFHAEIKPMDAAILEYRNMYALDIGFQKQILGINLMIFIIHFFFFVMNRSQRANLYLSASAFAYILGYSGQIAYYLYTHDHTERFYLANLFFAAFQIGNMLCFLAVFNFLERKKDVIYWIVILLFFVSVPLNIFWYDKGWRIGGAAYQLIACACILLISALSLRKQKKGAALFCIGAITSLICFGIFMSQGTFDSNAHFLRQLTAERGIWFTLFWLLITGSVSAYLAWDFSLTSKALSKQLEEVKKLSHQNLAMEMEKREILASQNQILETQVQERTAALTQSIIDLKSTQSQLIQSEKMASLGELTAGIAHEIQNPLNFVNNFSEVNQELIDELKEEIDKGNLREASTIADNLKENESKINLHGKRADGIVKSMLQHSRASAGHQEPTDVNKLVDEYIRLAFHGYRAKIKDFNVDLDINLDPLAGSAPIVRQDIGRVILNLLNNAFYAVMERAVKADTAYKPKVSVTTIKENNTVIIEVSDNGSGIPDDKLPKIFQPFFTTKPTGEGTGLGLSLSYDIITKGHGGSLTCDTKPNEYTKFTITLPSTAS